MACCAFVAFVIGQCLALAGGWRRRVAAVLHLGSAIPLAPTQFRRLPLKKGLLAALVVELGFASGCAIGAWAVLPAGSPLAALCGTSAVTAGR